MSQPDTDKARVADRRSEETRSFVRQVRAATRRKYTPEEKIRIVLEGFRREVTVNDLCRREGIKPHSYYAWTKEFMEAGKDVRRQNKWDKRGAFKACNLDANRLRQFSDLPTSVQLDSFASPPVSSPVWRLAVRGTYPPA